MLFRTYDFCIPKNSYENCWIVSSDNRNMKDLPRDSNLLIWHKYLRTSNLSERASVIHKLNAINYGTSFSLN